MSFITRLGLSRQRRQQLFAAALLAGASFVHPAAAQVAGAQAHFTAVGPVDPQTLFPSYYQDAKGDTLQLCTQNTDILGLCLFAPPTDLIDNLPLQQQTGFADEAFYSDTTAVFPVDMPGCPGCGKGLVLMSLEAAYFTGPPIVGDEFVFTRLRFFIDAPVAGKYRITHPFGVEDVVVREPGTRAINITKDIGSQSPDFSGPLRGNVGAFLKWDPAIAPAAPPGYVGDPNVLHEVTGGTYIRPGDTAPFNKVQFEYLGPLPDDVNGVPQAQLDLGAGPGQPLVFTQLAVSGQYYSGVAPAPLSAVRTTYSNGRTEVFVESAPDSAVTVSFDGGATSTPMVGDANGNFYLVQNSATMPALAQIKAVEPGHTDTTINATVTDAVFITAAQFDPATHSLAVTALTGITPPPTLNVIAFGQQSLGAMAAGDPASTTGTTQMTFQATGLPVGPAFVEVQSSAGGTATQQVQYLNPSDVGTVVTPPPPAPGTAPGPTANADTAQVPVGTPFAINVAQNDAPLTGTTLNLNSIAIVSPPTLGTIGQIGAGVITYIPGPNLVADGGVTTDSFTYTIADSAGNVSNPATVTVSAIPALLQPTLVQYDRNKVDWRVRANTSAPANSQIRATLVERNPVTRAITAQTLIGSNFVTAGTVDIRATGSPVLSSNCINGNNQNPPLCSVTLDDDFGKVTAGNTITIK